MLTFDAPTTGRSHQGASSFTTRWRQVRCGREEDSECETKGRKNIFSLDSIVDGWLSVSDRCNIMSFYGTFPETWDMHPRNRFTTPPRQPQQGIVPFSPGLDAEINRFSNSSYTSHQNNQYQSTPYEFESFSLPISNPVISPNQHLCLSSLFPPYIPSYES